MLHTGRLRLATQEDLMKRWRQGAFLVLLFLTLAACGDPSSPRIPEPDEEEEPTDPNPTMTRHTFWK